MTRQNRRAAARRIEGRRIRYRVDGRDEEKQAEQRRNAFQFQGALDLRAYQRPFPQSCCGKDERWDRTWGRALLAPNLAMYRDCQKKSGNRSLPKADCTYRIGDWLMRSNKIQVNNDRFYGRTAPLWADIRSSSAECQVNFFTGVGISSDPSNGFAWKRNAKREMPIFRGGKSPAGIGRPAPRAQTGCSDSGPTSRNPQMRRYRCRPVP